MRDQIRKFSAASVIACSIACGGGGSPTSPTPTATAPPPAAPPTAATVTLAVELSQSSGATSMGVERRGNNRQRRRFRARTTVTARNGRVRTNMACTATLGGNTQPIESLRRSDVAIDPATPLVVEGDVTIELNYPVPPGDLTGTCTATQADPTATPFTVTADGAIAVTSTTPVINPCAPSASTVCAEGGRFSLTVNGTNAAGQSTPGRVSPRDVYPDGGYFWFFNQDDAEVLIRVINGCRQNNRYWVFTEGLDPVMTTELTITVTDTATGVQQQYVTLMNSPAPGVTDNNAFATCP
jgi:hypothetical protein